MKFSYNALVEPHNTPRNINLMSFNVEMLELMIKEVSEARIGIVHVTKNS